MRVRSAGGHRRRALIIGLATLCTAVTAATLDAPAEAAGPAWRVVKTYNHTQYDSVAGVVALSSKNAWALSGTNAANTIKSRPIVQHWNGTKWAGVALPGGLKGMLLAGDYSSASNVWAIGGDDGIGSYVLRWNGRKWSVAGKWAKGQVTGVTVVSPKDVWVFGAPGADEGAGTWHYDGKSWKKVSAPFLPARATKVSGKNIWAIGRGMNSDSRTVGHWNGTKWSIVSTGSAIPPDVWEGDSTRSAWLADIWARSAKDIWIAGTLESEKAGGGHTKEALLVHWNGKSWKRVAAPPNERLSNITSDGKGGLWFTGWLKERGVLRHRTSTGKWSTAKVINAAPRYPIFSDLALIPGTTQLFGTGQLRPKSNNSSDGAIFRRS